MADRIVRAIDRARAERDAGMALAEEHATDWDRALVDQAIAAFAESARPFSANDLRPLIDVPTALVGARFSAAVCSRQLVRVGMVHSTLPNTHAKRIGLYLGTKAQAELLAVSGLDSDDASPLVVSVENHLAREYGPVTTLAGRRRRHRIAEGIVASLRAELVGAS